MYQNLVTWPIKNFGFTSIDLRSSDNAPLKKAIADIFPCIENDADNSPRYIPYLAPYASMRIEYPVRHLFTLKFYSIVVIA